MMSEEDEGGGIAMRVPCGGATQERMASPAPDRQESSSTASAAGMRLSNSGSRLLLPAESMAAGKGEHATCRVESTSRSGSVRSARRDVR
jgi:hypothetical protein